MHHRAGCEPTATAHWPAREGNAAASHRLTVAVRSAPSEEGTWSYLLRGENVEILQRGTLHCTKPLRRDFIRTHPDNPYAFAHAEGTPFFPMGDTCYGLF